VMRAAYIPKYRRGHRHAARTAPREPLLVRSRRRRLSRASQANRSTAACQTSRPGLRAVSFSGPRGASPPARQSPPPLGGQPSAAQVLVLVSPCASVGARPASPPRPPGGTRTGTGRHGRTTRKPPCLRPLKWRNGTTVRPSLAEEEVRDPAPPYVPSANRRRPPTGSGTGRRPKPGTQPIRRDSPPRGVLEKARGRCPRGLGIGQ
jgi:hypothetical protein